MQAISPGYVTTEFFTAAAHGNPEGTKRIDELFATMKPIDPVDIADAVVYILSTPPHVQVNSITLYVLKHKIFNLSILGTRYYDATNTAEDINSFMNL